MSWMFFPEHELTCKHCGKEHMEPEFMHRLIGHRIDYGYPMPLTSAWRCPEHDKAIGSSTNPGAGPHTYGEAIDVKILKTRAYRFLKIALNHGFLGIGILRSNNPAYLIFHIDTLEEPIYSPRPWLWLYSGVDNVS